MESGLAAVDGANGEEVTGFISPADAALIAAAPDMLAALEAVEAYLSRRVGHVPSSMGYDVLSQVRALIARARGTP
jgi:hypothetical protein